MKQVTNSSYVPAVRRFDDSASAVVPWRV